MNELITKDTGVLIPCTEERPKPKSPDVKLCIIKTKDFEKSMDQILKIPIEDRLKMGQKAFNDYTQDTKFFIQEMSKVLIKINKMIKRVSRN